jgi:hypothetical protein
MDFKGILSTKIVIFLYPKLLSFSVLTFIKWRLTPSYAAKDTSFWQKRPKTIVIGIIVQDNKNSNLFIWPSMWTRLEHAHCLETINNMWFSGPDAAAWMLKFVFVYLANTAVLCYSLTIICCCQVQDYIYWITSTENDHRHHHTFIKYEKRLRKEGKITIVVDNMPLTIDWLKVPFILIISSKLLPWRFNSCMATYIY